MNEIIVGVDGTATARMAAVAAAEMATNFNRPLHIVTSMKSHNSREIHGGGSEVWHIDSVGVAEDLLKALAGELKVTVPVTHAVVMSDVANGLVDEATRLNASMIVVGNKRVQGAARVLVPTQPGSLGGQDSLQGLARHASP